MRELLLDDSFSQPSYSPEPEKPLEFGRRPFIKTVGLFGVSLALWSKAVFAQDNEAGRWRDRVSGFVYTVCNSRRAEALSTQIYRAGVQYTPATNDFHYSFAAPFVFVGMTISPEEVICGNGFEVNRLPFYDVRCPCGNITDLNAFEIRRVTNGKEMARYGCVLAPASNRTQLQYADHADYRRTAAEYGLNPDQYRPEYKRVFVGHGKGYRGYQVADRTQVGTNSKPMRDVLLSSEDI
jgi:hypothetical protein